MVPCILLYYEVVSASSLKGEFVSLEVRFHEVSSNLLVSLVPLGPKNLLLRAFGILGNSA